MRCSLLVSLAVTLAVAVTAATRSAAADPPQPEADELARQYAGPIVSLSEQGKYREAIGKAADYELDVLGLYPSPTYELGLF